MRLWYRISTTLSFLLSFISKFGRSSLHHSWANNVIWYKGLLPCLAFFAWKLYLYGILWCLWTIREPPFNWFMVGSPEWGHYIFTYSGYILSSLEMQGGFEALVIGKTIDMQRIDVNERISGPGRLNPTPRPTT